MTVAQSSPHAPAIHPPKVELFDLVRGTNTDPKGIVRDVDTYRVTPWGLYLKRQVVGHPEFRALESWLLPALGLRITDWWFHPGQERDQDYYLDVVDIQVAPGRWRTEDHYLDLVVRSGQDVEVLDTDELLAAVVTGMLPPETADRALRIMHDAVDGLARHGYRLAAWLATRDIRLSWTRAGDMTPRYPTR